MCNGNWKYTTKIIHSYYVIKEYRNSSGPSTSTYFRMGQVVKKDSIRMLMLPSIVYTMVQDKYGKKVKYWYNNNLVWKALVNK